MSLNEKGVSVMELKVTSVNTNEGIEFEIDPVEFETWIEALESEKYSQTKRALQDSQGFCCLGVACQVLDFPKALSTEGFLQGGYPISQGNAPCWLHFIDRDFAERTGVNLTTLNDKYNHTFNQIAQLLKRVYVAGEPLYWSLANEHFAELTSCSR